MAPRLGPPIRAVKGQKRRNKEADAIGQYGECTMFYVAQLYGPIDQPNNDLLYQT